MQDDPQSSPSKPTRRAFLRTTGGGAAAAITAGCAQALSDSAATQIASPAATSDGPTLQGAVPITLRINGKDRPLRVDPRTTLLDCLRETVALTGTKKGCDQGQCGACTVHVNGRRVLACLTLAWQCADREVATIEGLARADGSLHPVQAAFIDHDAFQCGYCTPGQVCSAVGMLAEASAGWPSHATADVSVEHVALTPPEIRERMSGNICRCAAYPNIVAAIQEVHKETAQ